MKQHPTTFFVGGPRHGQAVDEGLLRLIEGGRIFLQEASLKVEYHDRVFRYWADEHSAYEPQDEAFRVLVHNSISFSSASSDAAAFEMLQQKGLIARRLP